MAQEIDNEGEEDESELIEEDWIKDYEAHHQKMNSGWRGCFGMIVLFFSSIYYCIKHAILGHD